LKILVTGGAGFIGSHVVEAYLADGHEVHVVDNLATGKRENVSAGATLHEADILKDAFSDVVAAVRPDIINHHAAQASVKLSGSDIAFDLASNGGGTARVCELAVKHNVQKLIYCNTGGALYGVPQFVPVTEDHPIKPISPYGMSKYTGELYVDYFSRMHGLQFTVLRLANAYGPRQDPHGEAGVVAIFTGKMLRGEECTIDGDGEQKKDYIYATDIARANVLALTKGTGERVNIGTGQGYSVNEIFASLQSATGNASPANYGPPRPGDVRNIWLENAKAKTVLGWEPEIGLDEGIRRTVESFR
jgi:UDP-glucose 4-epimerase